MRTVVHKTRMLVFKLRGVIVNPIRKEYLMRKWRYFQIITTCEQDDCDRLRADIHDLLPTIEYAIYEIPVDDLEGRLRGRVGEHPRGPTTKRGGTASGKLNRLCVCVRSEKDFVYLKMAMGDLFCTDPGCWERH